MAIELARYGVAVRIIDKAPQRTDKSKALVIWSRSLDKLARAGCSAGLVDAGYKVYSVNISAEGKSIARFTSSRPSANLMIPAVCGSSARTDIPPARRREGSGMRLPLTSTASYEAHSVRDPDNSRSSQIKATEVAARSIPGTLVKVTNGSADQQARNREQQSRRHHQCTKLQKAPGAHLLIFPPQGRQPQDGCQRSSNRQIRSEVHADEYGTGDLPRYMRSRNNGACQQTGIVAS
jgi:FAD binding domain